MKQRLVFLLFVLTAAISVNGQTWLWTQRLSDSVLDRHMDNNNFTNYSYGSAIATDNQENIYMVHGLNFRRMSPSIVDSFAIRVAKYDKHARAIWIKYFTNPGARNFINGLNNPVNIADMKLDKFGNMYIL